MILLAALVAACGGNVPPPIPPGSALTPPDLPPPKKKVARAKPVAPAPIAPKAATPEAQKKTITAIVQAFNAHDAAALARLYAPDAIVAGPLGSGWSESRGREALQHTHETLFAAIPDVKMATVRIAQRGSVSVMEWVTKGTHKGKWLGIGATNKPMGFRAATVMRFDSEGQVSEDHTYFDVLSVPLELGRGNGKTRPVPTLPADPMAIVAPSLSSGNAGEDTNATLVRALYAAQDKKSETEWTAALTDAVVRADQREAADTKGKDAVLGEVRRLGKDHAALTTRIRDVWAVGDIVVAEVTLDDPPGASTHRLDIYETTAGKITKLWTYGVRTGAKP